MEHLEIQGDRVPALGFGTWQLEGHACVEGVEDALAIGYRHIDTAQGYDNEEQVGDGIRRSGVSRDDIFLVTKVRPSNFRHDDAQTSTRASLQKLGTDYVDLLLLHWPNEDVPLEETLGALAELQQEGAVRHIGVSNFPPSLAARANDITRIFANQVEYHPFLDQTHLVKRCLERDLMLTAYSPLAKGRVVGDETLEKIGAEHGKSATQVVLRWLLQQPNVTTIPRSSSREHREANWDVHDFELTDEEMQRISSLADGARIIDPPMAPDWGD